MRFTSTFAILLMGTALTSLAQPPHVGTWAIDYAASDGGEQVWGFANLGSGLWEFRMKGRKVFHFRMDDEECPSCTGFHRWELIGPETYLTNLVGPWARDVVKIAPDGGSLSFIQRRPGATGELEDHVGTFQRFSGGPGLAGTWRVETEQSLSPPLVGLSPGVGEWFVFKWKSLSLLSESGFACSCSMAPITHASTLWHEDGPSRCSSLAIEPWKPCSRRMETWTKNRRIRCHPMEDR